MATLRDPTEYKGAVITHVWQGPEIETTVAVDNTLKLHYTGPNCVDHLTNSYKYNEEVHDVVYTRHAPKPVFRVQQHNGYYRIEAHYTPSAFDAKCKAWLEYRGYLVVER